MDATVAEMLADYQGDRDDLYLRVRAVLQEVGDHYLERGVATFQIHEGHDLHAFYRLTADDSRVVHVQGYPGLSTSEEMQVWARMMDYHRMMQIRAANSRLRRPHTRIGNEHAAQIQQFENFDLVGTRIPYDAKVLEHMLAESVPELR